MKKLNQRERTVRPSAAAARKTSTSNNPTLREFKPFRIQQKRVLISTGGLQINNHKHCTLFQLRTEILIPTKRTIFCNLSVGLSK